MLLLAMQLAGGGAGLDAKWRTNEAGYALTALVTFNDHAQAWPVAFMMHDKESESYWTTWVLLEVVLRNLPCSDPTCGGHLHC